MLQINNHNHMFLLSDGIGRIALAASSRANPTNSVPIHLDGLFLNDNARRQFSTNSNQMLQPSLEMDPYS